MRDELVEKVARAMVEPLGYNPDADWERIYVGGYANDEPGDLASMCRKLARAIIPIVAEACAEIADEKAKLWKQEGMAATEAADAIRQLGAKP